MKSGVFELIKQHTGKRQVYLTDCGESAILLSFLIAKALGKKKIAVPDQGGWLGFKNLPKKANLDVIDVKTDYGILDLADLKAKIDEKTALIMTNMAGYFAQQPIEQISGICRQKKSVFILDVTDVIETKPKADIVIASFGKWKPINLGYGGFIAFDKDYSGLIEKELKKHGFDEGKLGELHEKLADLNKRMHKFDLLNKKIKDDLRAFDIIHRDKKGINVVVKFKKDEEKNKIIKYCKENRLEYTLCPRYIRVNEKAVSIEVKRK